MFSNSQMWVFKEKNIYIVSREHAETHSFLTVFSCQFKVPLKGLRKINPFFFFEVLSCAWNSDSEVGRGKDEEIPQAEKYFKCVIKQQLWLFFKCLHISLCMSFLFISAHEVLQG